MDSVLFIFGTRPEAIKLAPVIKAFDQSKLFKSIVCTTGQHKEMLQQAIDFFKLNVDHQLDVMTTNQSLFGLTSKIINQLEPILADSKIKYVVVQGDTTTAFCGALAAYYAGKKVIHVEAGLRTWNKNSPFPEEINRALVGRIADLHFVPTEMAKNNLLMENVDPLKIFNVGNTVIDALNFTIENVNSQKTSAFEGFDGIDFSKKIILITGHRRESFGQPFQNILESIKELAEKFDQFQFIFPVHLNPIVKNHVEKVLANQSNIFLLSPLPYELNIWLMSKCYLVITDSGGIQEEAPSLGKPVIVTREVTERPEGVEAGVAKLVGHNKNLIISEISQLIENKHYYNSMATRKNPYGNGTSSQQIVSIVENLNSK